MPICLHECCDPCSRTCSCTECSLQVSTDITLDQLLEHDSPLPVNTVKAGNKELATSLKDLRVKLCNERSFSNDYLLIGAVMCTGLTDSVIQKIVDGSSNIQNEEDLLNLGVTSRVYCSRILQVVMCYHQK